MHLWSNSTHKVVLQRVGPDVVLNYFTELISTSIVVVQEPTKERLLVRVWPLVITLLTRLRLGQVLAPRNSHTKAHSISNIIHILFSLQCFDTVGWDTGRAYGCWFVGGDILTAALDVLYLQLLTPPLSPLVPIKSRTEIFWYRLNKVLQDDGH